MAEVTREDLDKYTVPQLKSLAEKNDISLEGRTLKAEIIDAFFVEDPTEAPAVVDLDRDGLLDLIEEEELEIEGDLTVLTDDDLRVVITKAREGQVPATSEVDGAEKDPEPEPKAEPEEVVPVDVPDGAVPVTQINKHTAWCPICDYSQYHLRRGLGNLATCGRCEATFVQDEEGTVWAVPKPEPEEE
jgi:hypothetical protein